jgi:steroid delta-isomerase-like uncharacterized protein
MRRLLITVTSLVLIGACVPADQGSPAAESVVLAMIDAVNGRDFEALDTLVAADVHRYSGATPDVRVRSLDDFLAFLEADLAAVPDAHQEVNRIFSNGDMVAVHVTYSGTQTGPMGPFPPSGRRVELPFIGLLRVADGQIAEIWVEWDNLNMLAQLGHFVPPGAAPGDGPPPTE